MTPKRMEGFVETPQGNHRVEMVELPDPKDPTAPPKKNTKDDFIYKNVARMDRYAPPEAVALAGSLIDRYGDVHRVIQQPVKQHDNETQEWALKVLHEVFGSKDTLDLLKAVAVESIAARKEYLDQKGYLAPQNPQQAVDDAFEQLTATIADALEPLVQEFARMRSERDLARMECQKMVMNNQRLAEWQNGFNTLLPLLKNHAHHFTLDIEHYELFERYLNAREQHCNASWLEVHFNAKSLPAIPPVPYKGSRRDILERWKKSKILVDELHKYMDEFPVPSDHQGQPEAINPDDVRTNIFNFPRTTAQQSISNPASTSTAAPISDGRVEKSSADQPRQPQTTNPDAVRTVVASTATIDKPSPSIRAPESADKQGAELATDQQRSKG